ncbi:MAG: type II toxin-antitoxin system VapC family toxin [Candidatus Helarchaeota archaeon]
MKAIGVFLDSGFFLGICHPDDANHKRSNELLLLISTGKFGLIYSSPLVISEAATLLLIRTKNNQDLINDFFRLLYGDNQFVRILSWSKEIELKTWNFFKSVNKKAKSKREYMSFVDASNVVFCREYNIDNIITFDRHFDNFLIRL